jgi:hypothetical protein
MVSFSKIRFPFFPPSRSPGFQLQRSDRRAYFSPHGYLRCTASMCLLLRRRSQDSEGQGCPCRLRHHGSPRHALRRLGEAVAPSIPHTRIYD